MAGLDGQTAAELSHEGGKIALLGLVASGLGIAIVSESMRVLGRRGVVYREIHDFPLRAALVELSRAEPSPRARLWLEVETP